MIGRRALILAVWCGRYGFGQISASADSLRGRLVLANGESRFQVAKGHFFRVSGDEPTNKILHDPRLNNRIFEAKGHSAGPDAFVIDPIETRPMVVVDGAKPLRVTYYCDVCSIRTYSPGPCMCCQAETRLDLIDPASKA